MEAMRVEVVTEAMRVEVVMKVMKVVMKVMWVEVDANLPEKLSIVIPVNSSLSLKLSFFQINLSLNPFVID